MHSIALRFLIALLLGFGGTSVHGQIYAVGTHRGPPVTVRVDEHTWLAGGWPNGYGLLQFRSRRGEGAPWVRQTTICFGRPALTVRLPALLVAAIGLMAAPSLVWLVVATGSRIRRLQRYENDAAVYQEEKGR